MLALQQNFTIQVNLSPHLLQIHHEKVKEGTGKINESTPSGISDLFNDSDVRRNTLIMFVNWMVCTLGYYGISMGAANLGENIFISIISLAFIEIPSYIFCICIMDHWGRKPIFISSLLISGVAAIPAGFLEDGAVRSALAMIGKFGATASFSIAYLYTAELYPTQMRSTAVGMCSMMARIGGLAAPQVILFD